MVHLWKKLCIALCLVPIVSWGSIKEYKLDNGLKLVVKADRRAPVVVSQVWYKVGSSYEPVGVTGVSHVLEHMMFKGTKKFKPGEFSKIIAANGGRENAFTSADYTGYYQELHKDRLEVSFEMEAERMRNLKLLEEEFKKEVKVVMEERRLRTEDNAHSQTLEHFMATAFINSPYGQPIIGWMDDLRAMEVADLQKWYEKWYAPNNATIVVVGDVDAEKVFRLAKKHFGPLKPSDNLKQPKSAPEVKQFGLRRIKVKRPAKLPHIYMGYHVPVLKTATEKWEVYALEVLSGVLDAGYSSRFTKNIVKGSQVANSISAGYDMYSRLSDLFMISSTPAIGKDIKVLEKNIRQEIDKVKTSLVSADELQRVKTQLIAGTVYQQDNPRYYAWQIGALETVGLSWKYMLEYDAGVKAVTAKQVQQVAKKYLIDDNLTIAELVPLPMTQQAAANKQAQGAKNAN